MSIMLIRFIDYHVSNCIFVCLHANICTCCHPKLNSHNRFTVANIII